MSKCPLTLANLFKNLSEEEAQGLVRALESMRENNPSSSLFETYLKAKKKIDQHVAMHRVAIVQAQERSPRLFQAFKDNLSRYNNPAVAMEQLINFDATRDFKDFDFTTIERRYAMELNGTVERTIYKSKAHLNVYTNKTLNVNGVEKNVSLLVARQVWEYTRNKGALSPIDLSDWGEAGEIYSEAINDIASLIHNTNERILTRLQESGLPVDPLEEYYLPTQHDPDKLHLVDFEQWLDDFVPMLDLEKTFGPSIGAEVDKRGLTKGQTKFFKKVFTNIAESNLSPSIVSRMQDDAFQNFGDKLIRERTFHFKDADSWHQYHVKYGVGEGNPQLMLNTRIKSSSHQLALMDVFGISPERTLFSLNDGVLGHLLKEKGISNKLDLKHIAEPPSPPSIPESMRIEEAIMDNRVIQDILSDTESIKIDAFSDLVKKKRVALGHVLGSMGFSQDVLDRLFNPMKLPLQQRPTKGDYASITKLVNVALKKASAISEVALEASFTGGGGSKIDIFKDARRNEMFQVTLNSLLENGEEIIRTIDGRYELYQSEKALYDQKYAEYQVSLENSLRERKSEHQRAWAELTKGDELLNKIADGLDDSSGSIVHAMSILKGVYSGRQSGEVAELIARIGANTRAVVQLNRLGTSVITNLNDFSNMTYIAWSRGLANPLETLFGTLESAFNARVSSRDVLESVVNILSGDRLDAFVGRVSDKELASVLDDFGVVVQNLTDALQGDMLELHDGLVNPNITKALSFMNETTGLERLNTTFKRAMGNLALQKIGKESSKSFDALPRTFKQELERFSITELDWDMAREFVVVVGDKPLLNMERLFALSSNKSILADHFSASTIAKLEKNASLLGETLEQYVPRLKNKFGGYVSDMIYTGSLTPNRFDKAYTLSPAVTDAFGVSDGFRSGMYAGKAGNLTREIFSTMFFQLKTYTMSYMNTVYRDFYNRAFQRGTSGDRARSVAVATASLGMAVGLGHLATSMRAVSMGYTPPQLINEEGEVNLNTVASASSQAVGMYFAVEMMSQLLYRPDLNTVGRGVFAPAGSLVVGGLLGGLGAVGELTQGEFDDSDAEALQAKAVKDIYRQIPFNNYLWTRALTDQLVTEAVANFIDGGVQKEDMLEYRQEIYGQEPLFQEGY